MISRTLKVTGKALKGKDEKATVLMKSTSEDGSKLELVLEDEGSLDDFEIGQILTVKIAEEQQRLG